MPNGQWVHGPLDNKQVGNLDWANLGERVIACKSFILISIKIRKHVVDIGKSLLEHDR